VNSGSALDNRLPEAGAGFVWDDVGDASPVLILRPDAPGVTAAFTTRIGGVSRAPFDTLNVSFRVGDTEDSARANREIAGRALGRGGNWSVVRQVHGPEVVEASPGPLPGPLKDADGLWTDDPDTTLAVLAADCVPLLVVKEGRVGLVHAGWRGLAAGVVERALDAVGAGAAVFAGPSIGPCCYEVGTEVTEAFASRFGPSVVAGKRVDLWAAAEHAARLGGAAHFTVAGLCTSCHAGLFFSHRRDKGRTGRQALLARIRDD
jgi:YfiH family protein